MQAFAAQEAQTPPREHFDARTGLGSEHAPLERALPGPRDQDAPAREAFERDVLRGV